VTEAETVAEAYGEAESQAAAESRQFQREWGL